MPMLPLSLFSPSIGSKTQAQHSVPEGPSLPARQHLLQCQAVLADGLVQGLQKGRRSEGPKAVTASLPLFCMPRGQHAEG